MIESRVTGEWRSAADEAFPVIKVLIVDDHPIARDALQSYLETESDIRVIGSATRARDAVEAARQLGPNVMLLDLELGDPREGGVEVAKAIRAMGLDVRLLVLTNYNDPPHVIAAYKARVDGYLVKTSGREDIIQAVRMVAGGQAIYDRAANKIIQDYLNDGPERPPHDEQPAEKLTDREWEVLDLVAQNLPNKLIAAQLNISIKTTKCHVSRVLRKLDLPDRKEAGAWYRTHAKND